MDSRWNPSILAPTSVIASQGNGYSLQCQLADVAGGTTTRLVVHARAVQAGQFNVSANVDVTNDGNYSNNYAGRSINVNAERDVKTRVSTEYLNAVVGTSYDIIYTLTAAGRLPADSVTMIIDQPYLGVIEAFTPSSGTCTATSLGRSYCVLGSMNPGDVRTVTVRVRMTGVGNTSMSPFTRFTDGANEVTYSSHTWIYSGLRVDVFAQINAYSFIDEGQSGSGDIRVSSVGIDPAQNVVATVEVPAPARLTRLTPAVPYTSAPWQCTLLTPQTGRCTGSFATASPGETRYFDYGFTSDTAMTGTATLTVSATDDADATNNIAQSSFTIRPSYDLGLTTTSTGLVMNMGEVATANFTVTTGHNPVAGAAISSDYSTGYTVEAVQVNGVDCPIVTTGLPPGFLSGYLLGDLPANASVPVTIRARAKQVEETGSTYVHVGAAYDSNYSNNTVLLPYRVQRMTDIRLSVNEASVTATPGTLIAFPDDRRRRGCHSPERRDQRAAATVRDARHRFGIRRGDLHGNDRTLQCDDPVRADRRLWHHRVLSQRTDRDDVYQQHHDDSGQRQHAGKQRGVRRADDRSALERRWQLERWR